MKLPKAPSPAMIVALIALFVSLGGTGYAVVTITGKNVKNSSLTGRDIRNNTVKSADVAGLRARDFRAGELPAGVQGPKGDKGEKGDKGDAGPNGARAYALVNGDNCSGSPTQLCPLVRNKGVEYAVRIGEGWYCVGVTGIRADAADSVAVVAPGIGASSDTLLGARWASNNGGCDAKEFEVETGFVNGTAAPVQADDTFTITIP